MKPGRKSAAELAIVVSRPEPIAIATRRTPPPSHLASATKGWWLSVVADYQLEPHHLRLLQLAAEAWDRGEQARKAIAKHGLTFSDDKGMVRARPEIGIERDCRTAFARLVRELDLDVEAPREERGRPPALQSNRG